MSKIRLTKEFHFEMAHALWNYEGLCRNIHGHSYKLSVTIIGSPSNQEDNPSFGMVIDFGILKKIVREAVVNDFDHAFLIYKNSADELSLHNQSMFGRMKVMDFQPTCENLLLFFVHRLQAALPSEIQLFSMKLYETNTSYAEWYSSDN